MQELQQSLTALNMARLGIQERDFLIATHERCESALASHATSLTTELDGAAQEVTLLFDRQAATNLCMYAYKALLCGTSVLEDP